MHISGAVASVAAVGCVVQQHRWLWCADGSPARDTKGFIYISALSLEAKKKQKQQQVRSNLVRSSGKTSSIDLREFALFASVLFG